MTTAATVMGPAAVEAAAAIMAVAWENEEDATGSIVRRSDVVEEEEEDVLTCQMDEGSSKLPSMKEWRLVSEGRIGINSPASLLYHQQPILC